MTADVLPPGRYFMPQSGGGRGYYGMRSNLLRQSALLDDCDRPAWPRGSSEASAGASSQPHRTLGVD